MLHWGECLLIAYCCSDVRWLLFHYTDCSSIILTVLCCSEVCWLLLFYSAPDCCCSSILLLSCYCSSILLLSASCCSSILLLSAAVQPCMLFCLLCSAISSCLISSVMFLWKKIANGLCLVLGLLYWSVVYWSVVLFLLLLQITFAVLICILLLVMEIHANGGGSSYILYM